MTQMSWLYMRRRAATMAFASLPMLVTLSLPHAGAVPISTQRDIVAQAPPPLELPVPGGWCTEPALLATGAQGAPYVCAGTKWTAAPPVANGLQVQGTPCRQDGIVAATADSHLLVCQNGQWILYQR